MPVLLLHGALHAVNVCHWPLPIPASRFEYVMVWPWCTVGTESAKFMSPAP